MSDKPTCREWVEVHPERLGKVIQQRLGRCRNKPVYDTGNGWVCRKHDTRKRP